MKDIKFLSLLYLLCMSLNIQAHENNANQNARLTLKEYVEFLVGRDGEFDQLVSSTIRRCKRNTRDDNSALVLVLPYATAEYRNNEQSFHEYYDEIEICAASAEKHFKSAHQIRNRSMVDRSDLVIFCVEHNSGGAYQTMQYARKVDANIINFPDATR